MVAPASPAVPGAVADIAPAAAPTPATALWPAITTARHATLPRCPWWVAAPEAPSGRWRAGSVARADLPALRAWPQWLTIDGDGDGDKDGITLQVAPEAREAVLATIAQALRAQGLIRAWRDELFPVPALLDAQDSPGPVLARIERASARFWGSLTFGAHCNGWVAGADGRPAALWIARRADDKPTDPGRLDNLIGGGVSAGQSPREAVLREGWEEAGLRPPQMAGLRSGRRIHVARDLPEGFQREWVSVYDLCLPPDLQPVNQDGEVQAITRMPIAEVVERCAAGELTVDATLATLDFLLRHDLLDTATRGPLEAAAARLWLPTDPADQAADAAR
ncbi:NUDIX hydrolase [Pseudaquabacterium rugosum]|uniref:DUF4743 domain-containing protein n=1 Tax=Pseudaquabacterium rugosum TaxID=2984194 RepID=A0ABU9BCY4_9BURK